MLANRLREGSLIGIFAPSHVADPEQYKKCRRTLESLGFRVLLGDNIFKNTHGYLASEQQRADDFNAMVTNDEVEMILFGGGEGGNELLPLIDYENIKKHPKLICSFSDGTTILNAVYAKTGLVTYYDAFPGMFPDLRYYDYTHFVSHFLEGHSSKYTTNSEWRVLCSGACEGILIGGYTQNFALMQGGEYFSYDKNEKYVLFLEDYEKFSVVAAVSSYISHIEQSGFINCVSGLIFGHYSETVPPDLLARLKRFGDKHNVPVAYCDDFGHGVNHAILPIGIRCRMDVDRNTIEFLDDRSKDEI